MATSGSDVEQYMRSAIICLDEEIRRHGSIFFGQGPCYRASWEREQFNFCTAEAPRKASESSLPLAMQSFKCQGNDN